MMTLYEIVFPKSFSLSNVHTFINKINDGRKIIGNNFSKFINTTPNDTFHNSKKIIGDKITNFINTNPFMLNSKKMMNSVDPDSSIINFLSKNRKLIGGGLIGGGIDHQLFNNN